MSGELRSVRVSDITVFIAKPGDEKPAGARSMYTLYFDTTDYPGQWVLREGWIVGGNIIQTHNAWVGEEKYEVIDNLPAAAVELPRFAGDHETIRGSWIV
jgi:hypothetical protein